MATTTFTYTGADQFFTIPAGVINIHASIWGAGGGGSRGAFPGNSGAGGYVEGTIPVNSGDLFKIIVGEGGKKTSAIGTYGGGGAGGNDTFRGYTGGSGGGRSEILLNNSSILISGGGGGNAGGSTDTSRGGSGGGLTGFKGLTNTACLANGCGGGGTQAAGGSFGQGTSPGTAGASYLGGTGGESENINAGGGGGGGGGYFGGGGGSGQSIAGTGCVGSPNAQDCPGGGGSSFISPIALSAFTLSVPVGTLIPPNSSDPNYITGVGVGVSGALDGGDGLVVLEYTVVPFTMGKTVDKLYTGFETTVTYTLTLKNFSGTTITNFVLIDTTPSGTTFVDNSLYLNNTNIPGDLNPPGLTIPIIPINATETITFTVSIPNIISQNPIVNNAFGIYDGTIVPIISNSVTTTISDIKLNVTKSSPSTYAGINQTITYYIVIDSYGTVDAFNSVIIDTIPSDTIFVSNSLNVNGTTIIGGTITPPGYTIGTIPKNTTTTISYQVSVVSVPNSSTLVNLASLSYSYNFTPTQTINNNIPINVVTIPLKYVDLSNLNKSVDLNVCTIGSVLTYTFQIPNNGTLDIIDAILIDTIPNGTTFIPNSVTIDGITIPGANIITGVDLVSIPSKITKTVTFQVIVN